MFRTLDDYKKDKKDNKDNKDKKTTNSYAGGEKSGLAIENPDDIHGILEKAEKNSKERPKDGEKPEHNCKITLYQNGFTIDDGQFRDYNDPANKKFMKELNQGYVPEELRKQYPKGLSVGLEDRKEEKYELPPPPKYIEFSGKGHTLGEQIPVESIKLEHNLKAEPPKVDKSRPTTTIRLILYDGTAKEIEVNLTTKVAEVFDYVFSLAPVAGEFQLIAGFPPKPITNVNQTIEEAGLEDSKVIQKLI